MYILSKKNPDLNKEQLWEALYQKAEERKTMIYLENSYTYLNDIEKSKELQEIWENYRKKNFYAQNITWEEVMKNLNKLFNNES